MNQLSLLKGYRMPGEFEKHHGCILIWPSRPGSWPFGAVAARKAFTAVAEAIAQSEQVYMLTDESTYESAREMLSEKIHLLKIETDDAWARDVGPTFVVNDQDIQGIDWKFNAWGGEVDGLYAHWDKDDAAAKKICEALHVDSFDAHPFVLEGGSIHSDGEGTLMVTEACLLSKGRNPEMSREEIEEMLCKCLGAQKVLWLPHGIWKDETNEHVDNVAAFVKPGEIVLAWCDNPEDPQHAFSAEDLKYLESQTDAKGRKLIVHKLPVPAKPVCVQENELDGYLFEEGEDTREAGERLAASYVNYYIANGSIVMPAFGDVNDDVAAKILAELYPERTVVQIPARDILLGGGNIHCITQQIPEGGILNA